MITMLALMVLGQMGEPCYRVPRAGHGCGMRATGRSGANLAFFEAFPASGAGTSGPCSTTAPTGAKGEVLTFTRASAATCTKTATGGLATTGIANGDLVSLSSNVARVEYDSAGTLGLLVEAAGANLVLQSAAIAGLPWADVGTPAATSGATDPFNGTSGVTITDDDGAAFEGRSQLVGVVPTSAYFMHCYVKAGTLAKARISIDGTTQDIASLSATTWSIVEKGDASASGAAVTVQVLAGNATTDTGTVIFGGCDAKLGTYRTSYIPTAGAAVTRAAETAYFDFAPGAHANYSMAATATVSKSAGATWSAIVAWQSSVLYRANYNSGLANICESYNASALSATGTARGSFAVKRLSCRNDGAERGDWDSIALTPSAAGTRAVAPTRLYVGQSFAAGYEGDGITSRVCYQPNDARCQ